MPKMDAVSSRNCAMMVQFPAAISCASLIASETKAKMTATMKEVTAVRYSILRCFDIVTTFYYMNGGGEYVPPPCKSDTLNHGVTSGAYPPGMSPLFRIFELPTG